MTAARMSGSAVITAAACRSSSCTTTLIGFIGGPASPVGAAPSFPSTLTNSPMRGLLSAQPIQCFLAALIDVRGKTAVRKMPAEFESHERAGGVAGDVLVIPLRQPAHRGCVEVRQVRSQVEVVVVDRDRHLLTERGQSLLDLGDDGFRLLLSVHRQAF